MEYYEPNQRTVSSLLPVSGVKKAPIFGIFKRWPHGPRHRAAPGRLSPKRADDCIIARGSIARTG